MAAYQIVPPEKFDFSTPEEWPKWIRRFERFRQASGLKDNDEEGQVNTLIYAMGDEADDILCGLGLSAEDKKKFDTVRDKFEAHFVKRRNTIFERAKFNQRKQEKAESADSFITSLYCLAKHCGYGALHDEMIRDRIVVGLRDATLSEKLQMDPELTLDKAVVAARQREAVKKQQAVVRGEHPSINAIRAKSAYKGKPQSGGNPSRYPPARPTQNANSCTRCGRSPPHGRQQCPAREAKCHSCGKIGHFKTMCRSTQTVGTVQAPVETEDEFLGTVRDEAGAKPWIMTLPLNGMPVEFKIDTGADVSVIPESVFNQLERTTLHPTSRSLSGPGQNRLRVCGQFVGTLKHRAEEFKSEFFVVHGLQTALLGRPAIEAMGLVKRVNSIKEGEELIAKHTGLFSGLGCLEGEYRIKLRENTKPFALSTPRRVALPLLPKVKAELERMEQLGVITRVDEPTDWCAGMVVVPKPNEKVHICVDLTKLNENVCRERHILPSVEHILAQLGDAKVFSKLDANSGFWQIKLSEDSALLTTFITPFGRFCFHRLPFGITSAPEHFQKRMSDILAGLEGVVCMVDDVLVYGRTQEEHDQRLSAVLERIEQAGGTLNREKCEFSKSSVRFLGQMVDATGIRPNPEKVKAIMAMKEPTTVTEVRRFLGMANQLGKFSPVGDSKTSERSSEQEESVDMG